MVTKDIKVSYGKRFDTGGCAYDQMLSIKLKSAEMLKLEAISNIIITFAM